MSLVRGARKVGRSKISKCCDSRHVVFSGSFDWISTASKPSIFASYPYSRKPILISAVEENTLIPTCVIGIRLVSVRRILFMERISKVIADVIQSVTVDVIDFLPLRENLLMHEYAFAFTSAPAQPLSIDNPCSLIANKRAPSELRKFIANASDVTLRKGNETNRWIARLSKCWSGMWLKRQSIVLPKIRLYHVLEAV